MVRGREEGRERERKKERWVESNLLKVHIRGETRLLTRISFEMKGRRGSNSAHTYIHLINFMVTYA